MPKWARAVLALVLSSVVAGLATAPIAAAHFNQSATFGLIANLLSVPLMGPVVIPAAVLAACLSTVHLAWVGLWIMGLGIRWILAVAHAVAGLDGAVWHIAQPAPTVLPLLVLGMLWVILWRGWLRLAGLAPAVLAIWFWSSGGRPDMLIADNGALVGVMTDAGRALNKPGGDGFAADSWLTNDGDGADRDQAFARVGPLVSGGELRVEIGALRVAQIPTRRLRAITDPCAGTDILIVSTPAPDATACLALDPGLLALTGAVAFWWTDGRTEARTVRQTTGVRLWNSPGLRAGQPSRVAREKADLARSAAGLGAVLADHAPVGPPDVLAADQ